MPEYIIRLVMVSEIRVWQSAQSQNVIRKSEYLNKFKDTTDQESVFVQQ